MSKLSDMIEHLCPDGVEYVKLGDYFRRIKGTPITALIMKKIANENGDITIYAGGKTVVNAFEEDIEKANITRVPAVLIQSRGIIDALYCDKPFTFKNEMWAYTCDNSTTLKFLCYYLKLHIDHFRVIAARRGSLPQISIVDTDDFEIPLPPLAIQQEIVRILDTFTQLQTKLQTELELRKKQYNYYREHLLTFTDDTPRKRLGDVCKIMNGKDYKHLGEGNIPVYGTGGIMKYVDTAVYDKPSVLLPRKGSIGNVFYVDTPFWTVDTIYWTKINTELIEPKFMFYFIQSQNLERMNTGAGAIPSLTQAVLYKIEIPLPPLEKQREIASILDKFSALTTSLTEGIPAEIELRRKQYNYYRELLLTFKRKQ